jgi:hypothetical protein
MRTPKATILILMVSAVVILLVGPSGDFPLSDDWSYAHAVRSLCEHGSANFLPWTGASLIAQAWYGAALCKLFGFSFEVLRASTLLLAVVGALILNGLLLQMRVSGPALGLALATVTLSPLYVGMAFTFMTDLPFTVMMLASVYCYSRALDESRPGMTAAGAVLAAISFLIRQHGLVVAATAALAFLLVRKRPLGHRLRDAVAACAVPLLTFAAYGTWLVVGQGMPAGAANKIAEAAGLSLIETANVAFRAVETLGLALLPVALLSIERVWHERRTPFLASLGALGLLCVFLYAREGALMFYLTNVQYDLGVGALTLRDVLFLGEDVPFALGIAFRVALTVAATFGAAIAIATLSSPGALGKQPSRTFVLLTAAVLFGTSLLQAAFYFDRYLLPVLPLAAAALAVAGPGPRGARAAAPIVLSWAAAAVLAWFAVAGTHDYMAWNRARYGLLDELAAEGIGPRQIDGGMEYNAWHLAAQLGTWPSRSDVVPGTRSAEKSWWWVVDDRYTVSSRPLDDYTVRGRRGYSTWLATGEGEVLMLERTRP